MKGISLSTGALAFGIASAFPHLMTSPDSPLVRDALAKRQAVNPDSGAPLPLLPPPFDAAQQHVSTTGQYAFVPPGSGDARGPCPGLNAMANHGYLPHNGIATIQQFVTGTYQVFGMAADLSTFLAIYGALVDGSGTGWSIEGLPHTGIAGSHHNYECDSSPLKSDLNQYGSNNRLIMSQFMNLYNRQPNAATANYNIAVLRDFRDARFHESISKNPYFYYGPFDGVSVSQAAYTFIYRFMGNKSAEHPEGILNKNVLKSFMAITGPENNLKWTKGYERIPDNWYKRNDADLYSTAYLNNDQNFFSAAYPELSAAGCNMGKVNTYNTIEASIISGGAYNAAQVAANPLCFSTEFLLNSIPLLGVSSAMAAQLKSVIAPISTTLGCTPITNANTSALTGCPGFSMYGGPTGPVAPGAIQS